MNVQTSLAFIHGKWINDAFYIMSKTNPEKIIPALYPLPQVEEYVAKTKVRMQEEIVDCFSNDYTWKETGEAVEMDEYFLDFYLNFEGDVKKFKRYLRNKMPTERLLEVYDLMVVNPNFTLVFIEK